MTVEDITERIRQRHNKERESLMEEMGYNNPLDIVLDYVSEEVAGKAQEKGIGRTASAFLAIYTDRVINNKEDGEKDKEGFASMLGIEVPEIERIYNDLAKDIPSRYHTVMPRHKKAVYNSNGGRLKKTKDK